MLWNSVNGATAYEVDRQNLDGSWQMLSNTIDPSDTSYPDTSLTPGTSYTYRMEAIDATGPSVATTSSIVSTRPDVVSVGLSMVDVFRRVMERLEPGRGAKPLWYLALVGVIGAQLFYLFGLFEI